jgi:hypothetical protein
MANTITIGAPGKANARASILVAIATIEFMALCMPPKWWLIAVLALAAIASSAFAVGVSIRGHADF